MDSEKREVVLKVIRVLDELGIPYLIGGSFASALYGLPRSTNDADLVAEIKREHVADLFRALAPDFYVNEQSIRRSIDSGRHFNVISSETQFKVDVFTPRPGGFTAQQIARRKKKEFGQGTEPQVFFASAEDTVLAKLDWYRRGNEVSDLQWRDVVNILKVQRDRLDLAYMRKWGEHLGVGDLLEEALAEAEALWRS